MYYLTFSALELLTAIKVVLISTFWLSLVVLVVCTFVSVIRTVQYMRYMYIQGVRVQYKDYLKFYKYCASRSKLCIQSSNGSYWNSFTDWKAVPQKPFNL